MPILDPAFRYLSPLAGAEYGNDLPIHQRLMVAGNEEPESRDTIASTYLLSEPLKQAHLIVTREKPRIDHEHRFLRRTEPGLDDRHRTFHQHHEAIPLAVAGG